MGTARAGGSRKGGRKDDMTAGRGEEGASLAVERPGDVSGENAPWCGETRRRIG